jgi:hypothetical protein
MEQGKRRRKKRRRRLMIIFLLLVFFMLIFVSVTYYVDIIDVVVVNSSVSRENYSADVDEECLMENYTYGYQWVNLEVDALHGLLIPQMFLSNGMDRSGMFAIQFMFVDENEYPFAAFQDTVEDVAPAFKSDVQYLALSGGQTILVTASTPMPKFVSYWAFADITPPSFRFCEIVERKKESEEWVMNETAVEKVIRKKMNSSLGSFLWQFLRAHLV